MESDWPHKRCALQESLLVTEVRWFMIYFPINPSVPCALGPSFNKCQARHLPSHIHSWHFAGASFLCLAKLVRASMLINRTFLSSRMSGNYKGIREGMVARLKSHEWQSSSGVGFSRKLAGSAHLGLQADGEGWGLHNTRLSHMSPNHTESLGSP